ncbi:MAG: hypothetical protein ACXAD7_01065 [Candidatus Kariarchaeaceae archaeon]
MSDIKENKLLYEVNFIGERDKSVLCGPCQFSFVKKHIWSSVESKKTPAYVKLSRDGITIYCCEECYNNYQPHQLVEFIDIIYNEKTKDNQK